MNRKPPADLNILLLKLYSDKISDNVRKTFFILYFILYFGFVISADLFRSVKNTRHSPSFSDLLLHGFILLSVLAFFEESRSSLAFLQSPHKNFLKYFTKPYEAHFVYDEDEGPVEYYTGVDQKFLPQELFTRQYILIENSITKKTRYYAPRFLAHHVNPGIDFRRALKTYDEMGAVVSMLHLKHKLSFEHIAILYEFLGINIFYQHFISSGINLARQPHYKSEYIDKLIFSVKKYEIKDGEPVQTTAKKVNANSMMHIAHFSSFARFCEKYPILEPSHKTDVLPEISESQRQLKKLHMA